MRTTGPSVTTRFGSDVVVSAGHTQDAVFKSQQTRERLLRLEHRRCEADTSSVTITIGPRERPKG